VRHSTAAVTCFHAFLPGVSDNAQSENKSDHGGSTPETGSAGSPVRALIRPLGGKATPADFARAGGYHSGRRECPIGAKGELPNVEPPHQPLAEGTAVDRYISRWPERTAPPTRGRPTNFQRIRLQSALGRSGAVWQYVLCVRIPCCQFE